MESPAISPAVVLRILVGQIGMLYGEKDSDSPFGSFRRRLSLQYVWPCSEVLLTVQWCMDDAPSLHCVGGRTAFPNMTRKEKEQDQRSK